MAWLAVILGLVLSICLPGKGTAGDMGAWRDLRSPGVALTAASSLDAQKLGEKPVVSSPSRFRSADDPAVTETDQESGATLKFSRNMELNVSFLYNRDTPSLDPRRHNDSLPLFNYSMNYRLAPSFKVGLFGYLYYPNSDQGFTLNRHFGERVMGLGPGIKYDLGRWSFVFKTQMETGSRERGDDWQNWLRVWYAF
jgi:hypothetical protein